MQELKLFIRGTPKAWKAPRFNQKTRTVYKPQQAKEWRDSIWGQAMPHAPDKPWTGPIAVRLIFQVVAPVSWPKWKHRWLAEHKGYPESKPDTDNLTKAVLDALKGIFFVDDRQVAGMPVWKIYAEQPGVRVHMWQLPGIPKSLAEAKAREEEKDP